MSNSHSPSANRFALTVGAVGVVYGDIGTSPLYAFREALRPALADGLERAEVLGVVSLLLWALVLIVSLKYVLFLLLADNRGEGGILALYALVHGFSGRNTAVFILGIVGAALFFGDAIITPAISVLSAAEGLKLITPVFSPYVVPISIAILFALFIVQSRGTGPLSRFFGPITVIWFLAMAIAGLHQIILKPDVLSAIHPAYAFRFLTEHGLTAFIVLGAVFLAVTGAEALYADLGHFGRGPIQLAWVSLVFPALALNYLGQGALVLQHPETISNPFFLLVPNWALPGMVMLATLATVIASQAVITGAFSMTRQAIQLGLLPRFEIRHTSETETGQIFVPVINILLLTGVLVLVSEFRSSEALAAAYGIAVCGTMVVTTLLAYRMLHRAWGWPHALTFLVTLPVLTIESAFLMANMLKVPDGGYVPLTMGAVVILIMWTWHLGSKQLFERTRKMVVPLINFIPQIERGSALRAPGTAVFLTSDATATPPALLHNLKHNGVLHEQIIVVTVETVETPHVPDAERATVEHLSDRFQRVVLRFGFMETPNVNRALGMLRRQGLDFEGRRTSFFLGRRKLVSNPQVGMPAWQDRLYILLARLAADPSDFYHLPRDRVVELGAQVSV